MHHANTTVTTPRQTPHYNLIMSHSTASLGSTGLTQGQVRVPHSSQLTSTIYKVLLNTQMEEADKIKETRLSKVGVYKERLKPNPEMKVQKVFVGSS